MLFKEIPISHCWMTCCLKAALHKTETKEKIHGFYSFVVLFKSDLHLLDLLDLLDLLKHAAGALCSGGVLANEVYPRCCYC